MHTNYMVALSAAREQADKWAFGYASTLAATVGVIYGADISLDYVSAALISGAIAFLGGGASVASSSRSNYLQSLAESILVCEARLGLTDDEKVVGKPPPVTTRERYFANKLSTVTTVSFGFWSLAIFTGLCAIAVLLKAAGSD